MNRIKIWMIRNGLRQSEVANRLGVSRSYLHQVLAGKRKAPHIRRKLVRVVGMPSKLVTEPVQQRRAA